MDLRHYDTKAHGLDSSYEDVQPGFSTPHGVARTSEMTLFPSAAVPAKRRPARQAKLAVEPPLLVTHAAVSPCREVFGIWSLPDRSTPAKRHSKISSTPPSRSTTKRWSSGTGTASGTSAT